MLVLLLETLDILDYVFLNRNLSKTHIKIISEINRTLKFLISNYEELSNENFVFSLRKLNEAF